MSLFQELHVCVLSPLNWAERKKDERERVKALDSYSSALNESLETR